MSWLGKELTCDMTKGDLLRPRHAAGSKAAQRRELVKPCEGVVVGCA